MIKVYAKTNEKNVITKIGSSIFLSDVTDFIEIDDGIGDRFAHAQSQYLEKGLTDTQGRYNYKLVDGELVEILEEEKPIIDFSKIVTTEERLSALESAMLEMILGGTK